MGNNRFTLNSSLKDQQLDTKTILLDILKKDFPNDPIYQTNRLDASTLTQTTTPVISPVSDIKYTTRDEYDRVDIYPNVNEYTEYTINTSVPTVDEHILDDLLDDEWEYFTRPNQLREPAISGL